MARKPLLGSPVLNREGVQSRLAGDDLMSRVIENDAVKHGRASPAPEAPETAILEAPETAILEAPETAILEAPETTPEPEEEQFVNKLSNQQNNKFINKSVNELDSQQTGSRGDRKGETGRKGVAKRDDTGDGLGRTPPPDPLTQAYLTTLSQPFPPADARAPRVLVAGRVRPEVSERFELACTLLKKRGDKQDVLNRALQVFIEHVVAHGGDIEI